MRLARLLAMPLPEVVGRGRQEIRKRLERIACDGGVPAAARNGILTASRRHDAEQAFDRFRRTVESRFFAGAAEDETSLVVGALPGVRERIVAAADAVLAGRFDLLGYRGLDFGRPPDWRLDPVSGRRSPAVHWSRLDPLDAAVVGDSKVVWELNRHQWLVTLAQAYRLTGDARYAEAVATHLREWLRANPPGVGINWASSLEAAFRLIAWSWTLVLLRGARALDGDLFARLLGAVWAHARHVERYLSRYFSPNTHLTGEALGLLYAGVVFPELRRAARWRETGARILTAEIARQALPDGVYFEQSTCYQRYTVEIYLHFLLLAERNDLAVPPAVAEGVQRLVDFLVAVRWPDGSMPEIGDADGGSLLPLVSRAPGDFRGVFSVAAAHFRRADYAWAARSEGMAAPAPEPTSPEPTPEVAWLLGRAGLAALAALRPAPPARAPSRAFEPGGYVVMRSGWEAGAHQLVLDAGPLGGPASGGHGHADLLSVQVAAFGEPYLVDPGTGVYTTDAGWRAHFRSTQAHSTVVVDGRGQADPAGPFAWTGRPRATLLRWTATGTREVAEGEHDAYGRLDDPVTHRRRVVFVKPRFWVVVDDLAGAAEHRVEVRFQLAPLAVTVAPDLWARARGTRGGALLVRAFAVVPLKVEVLEGALEPAAGWVSPAYGQRRPAPLLIYSTVGPLPLRIATLLFPSADAEAPPPPVRLDVGVGGRPAALVLDDGRQYVELD